MATLWHEGYLERLEASISEAGREMDTARYLSEGAKNAGLRKIWSGKAMWLSDVISAARHCLREQRFRGNWVPRIKGSDVWFFCSNCGYVIANAYYDADYDELGVRKQELNLDMNPDFCPCCGQHQCEYLGENEEAALRVKWENGEL